MAAPWSTKKLTLEEKVGATQTEFQQLYDVVG